MLRPGRWIIIATAAIVSACGTAPPPSPQDGFDDIPALAEPPPPPTDPGRPVAYVHGRAVRIADLTPALIETAGGRVLTEWVLQHELENRLARRGLAVDDQMIARERVLLLETLDPADEDRAVLLLRELRSQRGLGRQRFDALLWRNAAMRLLVRDETAVSPLAVQQEYQFVYGPRLQPRIIVAASLTEANALRRRVLAGEDFRDVAAEASTDLSSAQGGLLSPISPVDPTYPQVVRDTLARMAPGQVSDILTLDGGFGFLRLERKIDAAEVNLSDVRDELEQRVRLRVQRLLMQQLARGLIAGADVIVLDPTLGEGWRQQKALIVDPPAAEPAP